MSYDTVIKKYNKIANEMTKNEKKYGLKKGAINVLSNDFKILKDNYKGLFGVEADEDTLLFGRKIIEIKNEKY